MKFFSFLKPAPPAEPIKDEEDVKKSYKYWRWRTFYGMYVGYVFYYFSRKSLTFAMPSIIKDLGFTKGDLGILLSILSITYGASKFLSGILSDRSNPRFFMGFGLIITGILNIFFGFSSSILFFGVFWGLNGYFQGFGWPPCARLLTHWYSQKERGTWWGFWNTSHSVGGALIPLIVGFCAEHWGWRTAMYIPGALCIAGGLFVISRLRDTPKSLGLPPVEQYKDDHPVENPQDEQGKELTAKEILFERVLKNKFIWILAGVYFFVYVIRTGINDWSALFLNETKGFNELAAGATVFWFEIGGIFGSLAAGWASDKIFGGRRGPVNILFCLAVIFAVFGFWAAPAGAIFLHSALMFSIGFLIFGPQMLIGMVAAELGGKKAAGSANGFVCLVSYIGAAAAGYPLGKVCQEYGWSVFFTAIAASGIISVIFLLPLLKVGGTQKEAVVAEVEEIEADKDPEPVE